jgi:hypothetical protein
MKEKNKMSLSFLKIFSLYFFLLVFSTIFIHRDSFAEADAYEPDNSFRNAKPILIYDSRPDAPDSGDRFQLHNFYDIGDEDWVKFYAFKNEIYTIMVKEPGSKCNAAIRIYDNAGDPAIPEEVNDEPVGKEEYAEFICKADGLYYARIRQKSSAGYGENTEYKLVLYIPVMSEEGILDVTITPPAPPIADVETIGQGGRTLQASNGKFRIIHTPGKFTLKVSAICYERYENAIEVNEGGTTSVPVTLTAIDNKPPEYHSADYNPPDYEISLSELLRVIQIYQTGGAYHCDPGGEDGYALGAEDRKCTPHDSDYKPQDWNISLSEMLRLIQFMTSGYHSDPAGEDGFAPGKPNCR